MRLSVLIPVHICVDNGHGYGWVWPWVLVWVVCMLPIWQGLVFKSPVRSGFFPFWGKTTTATGFPILKKSKNRTGTVKDRSDPVFFSSLTGLDRFSPNQTETGPSRSRPMVLPYHAECLYIISYINIYYILHMQGSKSY